MKTIRAYLLSLLLISIASAIVFEVTSGRAYEVLSGQQSQLSNNKLTLHKIENLQKQTSSLLVIADLVMGSGETYLVENTLNELTIIIKRFNKLKASQLVANQKNILEMIENDLLTISYQIVEVDDSLKINDDNKLSGLLIQYDNTSFGLVKKLQVLKENATKKNRQLKELFSERRSQEKAKVMFVLITFIILFIIVIGLAMRDIDVPIKKISSAAKISLINDSAFMSTINGTLEIREMSSVFSLLIQKLEAAVNKKKWALTQLENTHSQLKKAHNDSKNTYQQLKDTQLQLIEAEKLETTGILAAGVAHEVKNPLAIIQLGADYLKQKIGPEKSDLTEVIDDMCVAIHRADSVIKELLDFNSKGQLKMEPENINDIISESISLVKHEAQKKNIKISTQYADKTPIVFVDRNKILQVIINLSINAIRAMDNGGELILKTRSISKKEVEDEVTLSETSQNMLSDHIAIINIIDNGSGISADIKEKIFEPFFTTKNDGLGTGLGLTVVQNIMRLHGASIRIKNNKDKGTNASLVFSTFEAMTRIEYATRLLDSPPNPEVDALMADLAEYYQTQFAHVTLFLNDREIDISSYGKEEVEEYVYPAGYNFIEDAALFGRHLPIIVADCREHSKYSLFPYVTSGLTVFTAFTLLYTKDGQLIGSVAIEDPEPRYDFTLNDADYLVNVTREIESIYGI